MAEVEYVSRSARVIPAAVRRAVIARDGEVCQLCGVPVSEGAERSAPDKLHVDHVIQWAEGGNHEVDNLRVTCRLCNMTRPRAAVTTRYIEDAPPVSEAHLRRQRRRAVSLGLLPAPDRDYEGLQRALAEAATLTARQRRARS